jgi:predicted amidohydrolase
MSRVLDALDTSGASIGLMPELTLEAGLLDFWIELVRDRPAPSSQLKWLLVGTGPTTADDPPINEAVIIDRVTGDIILRQRKVFRFTLTAAQLDEWALDDLLGAEPITEDLTAGESISVIESAIGRIAILVCEDLARVMDFGPGLRALGISHVFAPVFSKETKPHHWEHAKAKEYATETGAEVTVVNSLVVPRQMGESGSTICFLVHSPDRTRPGLVAAPDEVCVF